MLIAVKIITNEMIAEKLAVNQSATFGTTQNPIGLTIYDEAIREPYCIKVRNGAMASVAGACGANVQMNANDANNNIESLNAPSDSGTTTVTTTDFGTASTDAGNSGISKFR